jgi:hypothetical protein
VNVYEIPKDKDLYESLIPVRISMNDNKKPFDIQRQSSIIDIMLISIRVKII